MARITIVLPEPKQQYSAEDQRQILQAVRTLQQQLNFSYQTDIKNDADAFNYFFSLIIASGFSHEDLYKAYIDKDKKIHDRLTNKY